MFMYWIQILIENKRAVGISFIKDNIKHVIKANKEVIVSGGAVSSPQILMLSGIGPKNHLSSLKVYGMFLIYIQSRIRIPRDMIT